MNPLHPLSNLRAAAPPKSMDEAEFRYLRGLGFWKAGGTVIIRFADVRFTSYLPYDLFHPVRKFLNIITFTHIENHWQQSELTLKPEAQELFKEWLWDRYREAAP